MQDRRTQREMVAFGKRLRLGGGLNIELCGGRDVSRPLMQIGGRGRVTWQHRVQFGERREARARTVRLTHGDRAVPGAPPDCR